MNPRACFPLLVLASQSLFAAPITWDNDAAAGVQGGAGTWDTTQTNWTTDGGTTRAAWNNTGNAADTAVFSTTGGAVTVGTNIQLGGLQFTAAGYTLSGSNLDFGAALGTITSSAIPAANQTTINNNLVGTNGLTIAANGDLSPSGGGSPGYLRFGGNNSGLTGGIAITAGLVDARTNNAFGSNTITLTNNAGILDAANNVTLANNIVIGTGGGTIRLYSSATTTLNGVISGSGNLQRTDGGTLFLNGTNTHTGNLTNHAGILEVGGSGSLNSGNYAGAILNSGTLRFNTTTDQTLAGVISGGGSFVKQNSSKTTLTAANTFSGATTISAGTLEIGGAGSLGNGNYGGNITNNAAFSFASTTFQNLTGVISGTGTITQSGGVLTLAGVNTFTGKIFVTGNGNRFGINSDAALGAVPGSFVADAITLSAGTTFLNMTQAYNNAGGFNAGFDINLHANRGIKLLGNATLQIGYGKLVTINGVISGTGNINHTDGGTLVLNGANTFTGNLSNSAGNLTVANNVFVGSLSSNTGNLTLNGNNSFTGNVTNGFGTLVVAGAGNNYTGFTHIRDSGTLRLDVDNGLPDGTAVVFWGGTTFNVNGKTDTVGTVTTGSSADTNVTINLGSGANLKVTNNNLPAGLTSGYSNATVAGKFTGTGNIEYAHSSSDIGMWDIMNAANDFTGNWTVTRGRLRFLPNTGADASLGNAANDIIFNGDAVNTLANGQGKASIQVAASSSVTLGAGRSITLNTGKEGTFYTWSGNTFTVDGQITGAGSLRKEDGGTLLLNNTSNNYTGETKIVAGTVTLGNNEVLPNATVVRIGTTDVAAPTLNLNGKNETVAGLTSVQVSNAAVLTNGIVTNSGGTASTFTVGQGTLGSDNFTFGGTIQNGTSAVALTKVGAGTQTLTGANTYTGNTNVDAGTLIVNGSLGATSVTVANGATLGGVATLGGSVLVQGLLSPGNSPGTMTLGNTALTFSPSGSALSELGGTTRGNLISNYDSIVGISLLTLDGTWNVGLVNGFVPAFSNTFDLFDATSVNSSGFNVGTDLILPSLTGDLTWDTSQFTTLGQITVVPEPSTTVLGALGLAGFLRRRRRA